jgi:hypothetical protein
VIFADRIRSVGKQVCDESGKYPVNEDDEEILRECARASRASLVPIHPIVLLKHVSRHCERSEAIHRAAQRMDGLLRRCAPRNDAV